MASTDAFLKLFPAHGAHLAPASSSPLPLSPSLSCTVPLSLRLSPTAPAPFHSLVASRQEAPKKKKFEPKPLTRVGKKRKAGGTATVGSARLPKVTPSTRCKLRALKLERIKDFLLMEREFIANQEVLKPKATREAEEADKVDELRGTPLQVGTLDEMIDDNHAIVSTPNGPEYYVNILSIVDPDALEPGATVLLHNKTNSVVGLLSDEADPMVSVMKVDKAPTESYADIGGLDKQIQEMKEAVELPLTHPEL
jgi:26S proteasome regulatory subunit T2